ncbi:thioredoxin family protein [Erythrobacter aureus]|uniref:Thioredoxin n=1 Tax=Erythrobacter aureus TaxID=2182384 RepID=A0A345YJJ0_9SPHN|nr:thioredoxin family protein [Erythrobacter aureus]AXK44092.1 thioredoxin [Erythrobacter aureus]
MSLQHCTDSNVFKGQMADASSPLVAVLGAEWCGFCTRMEPELERLAEDRKGEIRFAKFDSDEDPMVGVEMNVTTLPLVVLYKDGEEVARRGSGNYDELNEWLGENGL